MKYILCLLMLLCGQSYAQNRPWTESEKDLFAVHTALVLADWSQTRHIAKNPNVYYEINPIFGSHPSVEKVDIIFLATVIGSYYWFDMLDSKREKYLITASVVRGVMVGHNLHLGIRMGF